jgi:hypothetical protein
MERYRVKTEQEMIESFGKDWFEKLNNQYPYFENNMIKTLGVEGNHIENDSFQNLRIEFSELDDSPFLNYYYYKPEWLIKL